MTDAPGGLLRRIDGAIGAIVEPVAAGLLAIEIVILAAGVVARYVLHNALTWSDELATILLLWLVMLGAVIAYRRNEHVRLTALLRRCPAAVVRTLDVVATTVVAAFALELLPASGSYLIQEYTALTPSLQIPRAYVIAAILVSLALILILAIVRLVESDRRTVLAVLASAAAIAAAAYLGRGAIAALGNANLLIFFVGGVGALVAIGVPIAFAFGFASLSYLGLTTSIPLSTVVGRMDEGTSSLILLAIPLFIVLGLLMEATGIARRLVDALASVVGHLRGGLALVLVFAMFLVSGISGSKAADMAAVAPVLFPEMERRGGQRPELVALLASSAAMAETIPPSLVLIIIGSVTGVSIGALFSAGLIPAAVAALALIVVVLVRSRGDRAELAPRASGARIARAFAVALPGFALPLIIRAAILGGVATATEVSTIGIVYALLIGLFVYRDFAWRRLYPLLRETAALTGAIMLIVATATAMSYSLTQSGFAQQLADVLGHAGGRGGFLTLSILIFTVLGSFLEGIPVLVLFGPLLFPIADQFGINQVQYAMVAVLAMGVGLFSPPLGAGYFGACAIARCDPDLAMARIVPYLGAIVVALAAVAAFPQISTVFLAK